MSRPPRITASRCRASVITLALVALLGLALAACGGDDAADRDDVARVAGLFAATDPQVCGHLSEDFMQRSFSGDREKCVSSARKDDSKGSRAANVEIDGEAATAVVRRGEDRLRLRLLDGDDGWAIDAVRRLGKVPEKRKAKRSEESDRKGRPRPKPKPSPDAADEGDRIAARGVASAFLQAVAKSDEQVLCGLLTEGFARRIVGVGSDGVAQCVTALKGQSFRTLRKGFGDARIEAERVSDKRALIRLDNDIKLKLAKTGSRYEISGVIRPK